MMHECSPCYETNGQVKTSGFVSFDSAGYEKSIERTGDVGRGMVALTPEAQCVRYGRKTATGLVCEAMFEDCFSSRARNQASPVSCSSAVASSLQATFRQLAFAAQEDASPLNTGQWRPSAVHG